MRNKNIFIRKETAFSVLHGNGLPVFANVLGYNPDNDTVVYAVNYPTSARKDVRWRYGEDEPPVIYAKPLAEFQSRFTADIWDEYARYA